ncbi:MAG: HutD family protein [Dongiaceae bacterium]
MIDASHYRVMPWKNGFGTTTEIAIDPPNADLGGGFRWRVSIAAVQRSGPFSAFPGYDRTIMVVEGDGMDLTVGDAPTRRLDRLFEPFVFSGDEPAECRLLGGPIRDFNLMVDRSRLHARLDVFELDSARSVDLPAVLHCVVYCFDGSVELAGGGSGQPVCLARHHTAVLDRAASCSDDGTRVAVTAAGSRTRIAVIGLTPCRPAA